MSEGRKGDMLQTVLLDLADLHPVTEYSFAKTIGRRWRFDIALLEPRIAIEVDGGTWMGGRHTTGRGHQSDAEKRNAAAVMGWRVLTYNRVMIARGDVRRDVDAVIAAEHEWCYAEWHRCDGGGPGEHARYVESVAKEAR